MVQQEIKTTANTVSELKKGDIVWYPSTAHFYILWKRTKNHWIAFGLTSILESKKLPEVKNRYLHKPTFLSGRVDIIANAPLSYKGCVNVNHVNWLAKQLKGFIF